MALSGNLVRWSIAQPLELTMATNNDTLDQLLSSRDPKDGLFNEVKKALAGHVPSAELDDCLEGEAAAGKANH